MAKILTSDTANGITETWAYDGSEHEVVVKHEQDVQDVLDAVSAANVEGVASVDGLGLPMAEVPIVVAMKFCKQRGIPWEKFLYTTEYDDQWGKFLQTHPNLAYRPKRKYHSVGHA